VVIDASVAVKWTHPDPEVEADLDQAVRMLEAIKQGSIEVLQPPHWLLETLAVIARLRPDGADAALDLLDALELPVDDRFEVLERAVRLAVQLPHHLFDTLYHAVALEHDALLVTADATYRNKARGMGNITHLSQWQAPR
jgi:predicted nucleic acid-binding protein